MSNFEKDFTRVKSDIILKSIKNRKGCEELKIEKINDNQIRCTLTKEDLEEHQVMLTELALGSDNAKGLFEDMMEQASEEFGFEVEDNPLMIEAVPLSAEKIVLVITKVDDKDELSDRFSHFTSPLEHLSDEDKRSVLDHIIEEASEEFPDMEDDDEESENSPSISPIGEIFKEIKKAAMEKREGKDQQEKAEKKAEKKAKKQPLPETHRIYRFANLAQAMCGAETVSDFYKGENTLYKDPEDDYFYLLVERNPHTEEAFEEICNLLSEFSMQIDYNYAIRAYFNEHFVKIIEGDALNVLASL